MTTAATNPNWENVTKARVVSRNTRTPRAPTQASPDRRPSIGGFGGRRCARSAVGRRPPGDAEER